VVLHQSDSRAKWKTVSMDALAGKPIFKIQPPPYVTEEIAAFVREKLVELPKIAAIAKESKLSLQPKS